MDFKTPKFLKPLYGKYLLKEEPEDVGIREGFKTGIKQTILKPIAGKYLFKEKKEAGAGVAGGVGGAGIRKGLPKVTPESKARVEQSEEILKGLRSKLEETKKRYKEMPSEGIALPMYWDIPVLREEVKEISPLQRKVEVGQKVESLEKAISQYEEYKREQQRIGKPTEGFVEGMMIGIQESLSKPTELLPYIRTGVKTGEYLDILEAGQKLKEGEKLSPKEQGLVEEYKSERLPTKKGIGYKIGRMLPGMPAWIVEFGLGRSLVGKPVEEATKSVIKNKIARKAAGVLAHSTISGVTNIPGGTAERVLPYQEKLKNPIVDRFYKDIGGEFEWEKAVVRSFGSQFIETASEYAGEIIQKPLNFLSRATLGKFLSKTGIELTEGGLTKAMKEYGGWHGIIGEVFEEEIAAYGQAPIEGKEYKAPWTPEGFERLLVETLGIGIFQGLVTAVDVSKGKKIPIGGTIKEVGVPEDLRPLAEEARRYKSFEEFIKASDRMELSKKANRILRGVYVDEEKRITKSPDFDYEEGEMLTIYRVGKELDIGDWVSLSREYVEDLQKSRRGKEIFGVQKIRSKRVPAKDIVWAGTDRNEFFYAPKRLAIRERKDLINFYNQATKEAKRKGQRRIGEEKLFRGEEKEKDMEWLEDILGEEEISEFSKKLEKAESKVMTEMEESKAGERIFIEQPTKSDLKVIGRESSYPDWIPSDLRRASIFKGVLKYLRNDTTPPIRNNRQRELYKIVTKEILNRSDLTDEQIDAVLDYALPERIIEKEVEVEKPVTEEKIVEKPVVKEKVVEKQPEVPEFEKAEEEAPEFVKERREIEKELPREWLTPKQIAVKIRAERERGKHRGRVEARKEILEDFRNNRSKIEDTRKKMVNYTKENLEPDDRGKMLVAVRNARTKTDLKKAMQRVERYANKARRKSLRDEILKLEDRLIDSPSIDVEYRNKIRKALDEYELHGHRKSTIKELESTRDYIQKQKTKGKEVEIPERVLDSLEILSRKPFKRTTAKELQTIRDEIKFLAKLGKTKLRSRKAIREAEKEKIKKEIIDKSEPIEKILKDENLEVGKDISLTSEARNSFIEKWNKGKDVDLSILPMDVIMDMLDGSKGTYDGIHFRNKSIIDTDWGHYKIMSRNLIEPAENLAKELDLDDKNMERIGFYGAKVQKDGKAKLMNLGYSEEYIENFELNEKETKFYEKLRSKYEETYPLVKEFMKRVYNIDIGDEKNYMPFLTDWSEMSDLEVYKRIGEDVPTFKRPTKQVEKGFTKKRKGPGEQKIELDAMKIYRKHMDNISYLLKTQENIKKLYEVYNTEEIVDAMGETGNSMVIKWLDTVARNGGGLWEQRIGVLDTLREHTSVAIIGGRLSTIFIQISSIVNGAEFIGNYTFKGASDIATNRAWRDFVLKFPEIRNRVGDDPAYKTFEGENGWYGKAKKKTFWGIQRIDRLSAMSVAAGAYRKKMNEMGKEIDLTKEPNKKAMKYAQLITRRTQASMYAKDLPLAISRGELTGNKSVDKALLQFQTFPLNNWSVLRYDFAEVGIKAETKSQKLAAANKLLWLLVATFAETMLRGGADQVERWITGEEEDDDFWKDYLRNFSGNFPALNMLISPIVYGGQVIPALDFITDFEKAYSRIVKGKKTKTKIKGLPNLFEGIGKMTGMPGSSQVAELWEDWLENRLERKAKAGGGPSLKMEGMEGGMPSLKMEDLGKGEPSLKMEDLRK